MGGDHKCPVCPATFTRPQHVVRHIRWHAADCPYECQRCGDKFTRSDLLTRHVNKRHSNKKPLTTANADRRQGSVSAPKATTSKQACNQCVQSGLPGLSTDGTPFFSNAALNMPPGDPNTAPMPPKPNQNGSGRNNSNNNGSIGFPTPGSAGEAETRELRDFWKAYIRTPLSGPGPTALDAAVPAAQAGTVPGTNSSRRFTSPRRTRVASLSSVKTPTADGGDKQHDPLVGRTSHIRAGGTSSIRTTLHETPDDLRSFEAAVLAHRAPMTLNLVPRWGQGATSVARVSSQVPQAIGATDLGIDADAMDPSRTRNATSTSSLPNPFEDAFWKQESTSHLRLRSRELTVSTTGDECDVEHVQPSSKRLSSQTLKWANTKRALSCDEEDSVDGLRDGMPMDCIPVSRNMKGQGGIMDTLSGGLRESLQQVSRQIATPVDERSVSPSGTPTSLGEAIKVRNWDKRRKCENASDFEKNEEMTPTRISSDFHNMFLSLGHGSFLAVADLTEQITITEEELDSGGFAIIHRGHWRSSKGQHDVAVKVLRVLKRGDNGGLRLFKRLGREIRAWHHLNHPKLLGVSYHMKGRPAMIMHWHQNGNATKYLAERRESIATRIALVNDVARGLTYLHTLDPPVVHGDLKGNNVLITDDGRAALSDFGLSQIVEEINAPSGLTTTTVAGSTRWQAPEVIAGESDGGAMDQLATASDVWSFACTAYEFLTGLLPYYRHRATGAVVIDIMKHVKPQWEENGLRVCEVSDEVQNLLDCCWSFDAWNRPAMREVLRRLDIAGH